MKPILISAAGLVLAGRIIATETCPTGAVAVLPPNQAGTACCTSTGSRRLTRRNIFARTDTCADGSDPCCTDKAPGPPQVQGGSSVINLQCGTNYGDDNYDVEAGVLFDVVPCPNASDGDCFHTKITVASGATITDTHLQIDDVPLTVNTGLGKAPWIDKTYCNELAGECWVPLSYILSLFSGATSLCDEMIYVAAGVGISYTNSDSTTGTATCFQQGPPISDKGNWFGYATVTFDCPDMCTTWCCCQQTGTMMCEIGTAYGYNTFATTFNPSLVDAGATGCNKWGWYFKDVVDGTTLSGDLLVGAGGNDISKATNVGSFSATVASGSLEVMYSLDPAYDLMEVHVYASCTAPTTCSPGQYTYNSGVMSGTSDTSFTQTIGIDCTTGPYYLIFHAKVDKAFPAGSTCPAPVP